MPRTDGKGHEALRRGRWTECGAEYFITICTDQHKRGLTELQLLPTILGHLAKLETEQLWHVRTATIMPNHVHLLVVLGESVELSSVIRLFKGRLAPALRVAGIRWERGYFDHRIRPDEDRHSVFLYIFLNPYRKKLVEVGQQWSGYVCAENDWAWFGELTNSACPFPEWLA